MSWRAPEAPTYSVSELGAEVRDLLGEAYPSVWVAGEIHRARASARGHYYFELVEKGARDAIVGKVDAVIWRTDHMRIARLLRQGGQRLSEGQEVRCRVQIDFYPPMGRLQVVVREVDPLFTLGSLARRRAETLAALEAASLLERNRHRPLAAVPLDVVLVTSPESAAFHDFASGLAESGYGFRVFLLPVAVQGAGAERALVGAFATIERVVRAGAPFDAVAVIRGGGARTDLAVFDSRAVAEAVARCPLPVIAGLGHETDESVVDHVAHTALKTPTQAAAFLVERVRRADDHVLTLQAAIAGAAAETLRAAHQRLERTGTVIHQVRHRLRAVRTRLRHAAHALTLLGGQRLRLATAQLDRVADRLRTGAPSAIDRARPRATATLRRIALGARRQLHQADRELAGHQRLCAQLAPERTLARGYSITRATDGRVVRDASVVTAGERLVTTVAAGRIDSTVRGIHPAERRDAVSAEDHVALEES